MTEQKVNLKTYAAYYENEVRMESSSGGIFSLLAIATAPFTRYSAPPINNTKPIRIKNIEVSIF